LQPVRAVVALVLASLKGDNRTSYDHRSDRV
jgi:hypothetical protein